MATLLLGTLAKNAGWNAFWSGVATMAGSYIDQNYLFPQKVEGNKLQDLKIQTSTYGANIPKAYGKAARISGNIIWGTNFVEHKKTSRQGGKGGGGAKVTEYSYSVSFAVGLGKGTIKGIKRVWSDGKAFPLYESKYLVTCPFNTGDLGELMLAYLMKQRLVFSVVDSTESSIWTLTAKNATVDGNEAQVLGVKDADGNEYPDAYFGVYYDNEKVKFSVDKKSSTTTIPNGQEFTLTVEPHTAKYDYTLHLGTEDQMPDSYIESIEGTGNVPGYRGLVYIVFKNLYVDDFGRRIPNLTFEVEPETSDLKTIVEEISVESGLALSDIDASALAGYTVTGLSIERASSGRDRIEPLMTAYLFDGIEENGKIYFKFRNTDDAIYIPYSDLGAYEGDKIEPLTITKTAESELPRSLTVKYISADFDYQEQTQQSKRQITKSKQDSTLDTGLVMTDAEAKDLADIKLYEAWMSRTTYETVLTSKYAYVCPGKILATEDDKGNVHYWVVTKSTYGKPGLNKVSGGAIAGIDWGGAA